MVKEGLSNLELFCGVAGMLCPVPVAGEALLAGFLYPIVKEIPIFKPKINEGNFPAIAVSFCSAGLARFQLYPIIYEPMINYLQRFL